MMLSAVDTMGVIGAGPRDCHEDAPTHFIYSFIHTYSFSTCCRLLLCAGGIVVGHESDRSGPSLKHRLVGRPDGEPTTVLKEEKEVL